MKANLQAYLRAGDANRLAAAFTKLAQLDEVAGDEWQAISEAGAEAAAAGDLNGARSTCKTCHDQYRKAYREQRRAAPLAFRD